MGLDARNPLVGIGIISVICTVPAVVSTVYRLYIRRGRYWADDVFALFSACSQFVMFAGAFVHITHSSPHMSMVAAYYMMASAFYSVVWFARLSILFSIIRIHPDEVMRKRLYWVAGVFVLVTVVLISQLYWVCEPEPSWKDEASPQCALTRQVVILQIITDVFADAILVFVPLRLIQTIADRKLRHRLAVIFSTCLITTAVSIVHAVFIIIHAGPQEVMAAIAEDCVSLIVCNVPVVATRLIKKWAESRFSGDKLNPRTTGGGPLPKSGMSLKFATWKTISVGAEKTADMNTHGGVSGAGTDTMTGTVGWFRWERELPEDSSTDTTGEDPVTRQMAIEIDHIEANPQRHHGCSDRRPPEAVTLDLKSHTLTQADAEDRDSKAPSTSSHDFDSSRERPPKHTTVTWTGS